MIRYFLGLGKDDSLIGAQSCEMGATIYLVLQLHPGITEGVLHPHRSYHSYAALSGRHAKSLLYG